MERCLSNKEIEEIQIHTPKGTNSNNNSGIAAALIEIIKKLFNK